MGNRVSDVMKDLHLPICGQLLFLQHSFAILLHQDQNEKVWSFNTFSTAYFVVSFKFQFKDFIQSGWPQTWKTWKTWKTQGIYKWSKSQGKLREIWIFVKKKKPWKTQGKWKTYDIIANKNAFHRIFFSWVALRKILKGMPWKSQEKLGDLVSQKCGHPDSRKILHLTSYNSFSWPPSWNVNSL